MLEVFIKAVNIDKELIIKMREVAKTFNFKVTIFEFASVELLIKQNRLWKRKGTFENNFAVEVTKKICILILNKIALFPNFYLFDDRVVLCTSLTELLMESDLAVLYEIWAQPLTPLTTKFFFKNMLMRLELEYHTTLDQNEYQKKILSMAHKDFLTGLATRWYLQEYAEENRNEKNFTFIYFDLDKFKQVNDTYGHQTGDKILTETARKIKQEFKDGFGVRLGGDEFAVILKGKINIEIIKQRVNKFFRILFEFYSEHHEMENLSISAGISQSIDGNSKSLERLMRESDIALYRAKNSGRACYVIYEPSMNNDNFDE